MNKEWIAFAQEETGRRVFGWSKHMQRTHWPPALLPGQCIEDLEWLCGQLRPPPFVVWGVPGGVDLMCHLQAACLRLDRWHGIRPRLLTLLDEMVGPCPPSVSVVRSFLAFTGTVLLLIGTFPLVSNHRLGEMQAAAV